LAGRFGAAVQSAMISSTSPAAPPAARAAAWACRGPGDRVRWPRRALPWIPAYAGMTN